jgi:hypothetical protein
VLEGSGAKEPMITAISDHSAAPLQSGNIVVQCLLYLIYFLRIIDGQGVVG